MDTLILQGHPGRTTYMHLDNDTRVRADGTSASRSGCHEVSATPPLAIGLRVTIWVIGYTAGGIALIWLSALISAVAAGVLSGIYMVVGACVIMHMAFTSLATDERSSVGIGEISHAHYTIPQED
jgi:hypothetical protein